MAVNKVVYDGATLVDLTGDTVTADNLAAGVKATGADGRKIVGLLPKVTIDSVLNASSTNPVQNKVIAKEFEALMRPSGMLAIPSSDKAYVGKLAADALSIINDITQTTIEQSADGEHWETLFDSDTANDRAKLLYTNGVNWGPFVTISKGYIARITFATHTTTYFASIAIDMKIIRDSATTTSNPYKCYAGFNSVNATPIATDTIATGGSTPSAVFENNGYNIVQYVFNEDRQDLTLYFAGVLCKGTMPYRNVLKYNSNKQCTTTSFDIEAPNFIGKVNGYTIEASVPTNAKFTDTVYTHPSTHPASMITGLASVATSGDYDDLTNKPTIPTAVIVDDTLDADSTNAVQNKVVYGLGQNFLNRLRALSAVARSGSYNDLTDTPGMATTTTAGLMSAADKEKLDNVDADAGSVKLVIYN